MGKRSSLDSFQIGKMPPQSIDFEESVLGAIMIEKDAILEVVDILKPESFYKESHSLIYEACLDLFNESNPIDMRMVSDKLRKKGKLEEAGGAYYMAELTSKVSAASNIVKHARIIQEMAMKRELIVISSQIQQSAYEDTEDVFTVLELAEVGLSSIVDNNVKGGFYKLSESVNETVDKTVDMKNVKLTGVPSGFHKLDKITGGWQDSDLIVIGARPGMGKTGFVVSTMINAAKRGKSVAMFSLEMSRLQLDQRIISMEAGIPLDKVRKPYDLTPDELTKIKACKAKIANYNIFIDDTAGLTSLELKAKLRRLSAKHDIDMAVVDYLQLMKGTRNDGREQEISEISRSLKGVAKELDIPVIALSQLSRAVEGRADKRPMLSDLRESGAIEQDADLVGFLFRPEYYKIYKDANGQNLQGKGVVIISKNRQGALDDVYLNFNGPYIRWENEQEDPNEIEF